MVVASAWAPLQPELLDTGAACQLAPCGTLEDPGRWRRAWWLWSAGALVATVAAALALAPRRPDVRGVLLLAGCAALLVLPVAVLVLLLSALTSVHGAATAALSVVLPGVAVVGSWGRGGGSRARLRLAPAGRLREDEGVTELLRTHDPALIGLVQGLLDDAGIPHADADRHAHTIEGGIGVFPVRILVPDDARDQARTLLAEAGLGEWLRG